MSRIGKSPIILSKNIDIKLKNNLLTIKGPKGELKYTISNSIGIEQKNKTLVIYKKDKSKIAKKLYGLSRTIINNMVIGVSEGFCKVLEIHGVGYRAQIDNQKKLILNVGYSHPISIQAPPKIAINVENNTTIKIQGINKETIGQLAAQIRSLRPPEPYKGKGIRYQNEIIRKKVGKAGK